MNKYHEQLYKLRFAFIVSCIGITLFILGMNHQTVDALLPTVAPWGAFTVALILLFALVRMEWKQLDNINTFKHEFLTIISHKFRTPLTGIKWAAKLLREPTTEQQKIDISKQIDNAGERLIEIVEILSQFSKIDSEEDNHPEAINVHEIIESILEKYSERTKAKSIVFNINVAKDIPLVVIDKIKMQFATEVLIENAIEYTPESGAITVSVAKETPWISIAVTDTGIGMSKQELGNVFRQFYRSDEAKSIDTEGMGLGLYISKKIIERNNGTITATSGGEGKGSTFTIKLKI